MELLDGLERAFKVVNLSVLGAHKKTLKVIKLSVLGAHNKKTCTTSHYFVKKQGIILSTASSLKIDQRTKVTKARGEENK